MELYDLIAHLVRAFEKLGIKYFLTGSMASFYYGEPRFTNDIDVVADIREDYIPGLLKAFPETAFYISEDSIRRALRDKTQFNIIQPSVGLKIDVMIRKKDAFDDSRFKRIKRISPLEGLQADFASPEDVIIMKLKYYKEGKSDKHIRDIRSMLKISADLIDRSYIESWVDKLKLHDMWRDVLEGLKK
jgi:hypothetical protein